MAGAPLHIPIQFEYVRVSQSFPYSTSVFGVSLNLGFCIFCTRYLFLLYAYFYLYCWSCFGGVAYYCCGGRVTFRSFKPKSTFSRASAIWEMFKNREHSLYGSNFSRLRIMASTHERLFLLLAFILQPTWTDLATPIERTTSY